MLLPANFDTTRKLVAARFFDAYDLTFGPGDTVPVASLGDDRGKEELDTDTALRLWLVGYIVYEDAYRPTPSETPAQEAQRVVETDDLGGGWYLIRAPWLGEGEKVQGREAAEARRDQIAEKGDTKGVTVSGGQGGWYLVDAPWLDDAVKVQGKDNAAAKEAELIAAGPPEGWVPETEEAKTARLQRDADEQARLEQEAKDKEVADAAAAKEQADREAAEAAAAQIADNFAAHGYNQDEGKDAGSFPTIQAALDSGTLLAGDRVLIGDDATPHVLTAEEVESKTGTLLPVDGPAADVIVSVGDKDWTVTAPWLEKPETFDTVEAAEARQKELRDADPPEGWVRPADQQAPQQQAGASGCAGEGATEGGSAELMADQIDIIIADLADYTRLEVVALSMNMVANLQEEPPLGTPVQTGWARANWLPSVGEPNYTDADVRDPNAAQVAARLKESNDGLNDVLAWKNEDGPIFATNNVPYIEALNAGHSTQSPPGFVQEALEKAVRETYAAAASKGARERRAEAARTRAGKPSRKPGR